METKNITKIRMAYKRVFSEIFDANKRFWRLILLQGTVF